MQEDKDSVKRTRATANERPGWEGPARVRPSQSPSTRRTGSAEAGRSDLNDPDAARTRGGAGGVDEGNINSAEHAAAALPRKHHIPYLSKNVPEMGQHDGNDQNVPQNTGAGFENTNLNSPLGPGGDIERRPPPEAQGFEQGGRGGRRPGSMQPQRGGMQRSAPGLGEYYAEQGPQGKGSRPQGGRMPRHSGPPPPQQLSPPMPSYYNRYPPQSGIYEQSAMRPPEGNQPYYPHGGPYPQPRHPQGGDYQYTPEVTTPTGNGGAQGSFGNRGDGNPNNMPSSFPPSTSWGQPPPPVPYGGAPQYSGNVPIYPSHWHPGYEVRDSNYQGPPSGRMSGDPALAKREEYRYSGSGPMEVHPGASGAPSQNAGGRRSPRRNWGEGEHAPVYRQPNSSNNNNNNSYSNNNVNSNPDAQEGWGSGQNVPIYPPYSHGWVGGGGGMPYQMNPNSQWPGQRPMRYGPMNAPPQHGNAAGPRAPNVPHYGVADHMQQLDQPLSESYQPQVHGKGRVNVRGQNVEHGLRTVARGTKAPVMRPRRNETADPEPSSNDGDTGDKKESENTLRQHREQIQKEVPAVVEVQKEAVGIEGKKNSAENTVAAGAGATGANIQGQDKKKIDDVRESIKKVDISNQPVDSQQKEEQEKKQRRSTEMINDPVMRNYVSINNCNKTFLEFLTAGLNADNRTGVASLILQYFILNVSKYMPYSQKYMRILDSQNHRIKYSSSRKQSKYAATEFYHFLEQYKMLTTVKNASEAIGAEWHRLFSIAETESKTASVRRRRGNNPYAIPTISRIPIAVDAMELIQEIIARCVSYGYKPRCKDGACGSLKCSGRHACMQHDMQIPVSEKKQAGCSASKEKTYLNLNQLWFLISSCPFFLFAELSEEIELFRYHGLEPVMVFGSFDPACKWNKNNSRIMEFEKDRETCGGNKKAPSSKLPLERLLDSTLDNVIDMVLPANSYSTGEESVMQDASAPSGQSGHTLTEVAIRELQPIALRESLKSHLFKLATPSQQTNFSSGGHPIDAGENSAELGDNKDEGIHKKADKLYEKEAEVTVTDAGVLDISRQKSALLQCLESTRALNIFSRPFAPERSFRYIKMLKNSAKKSETTSEHSQIRMLQVLNTETGGLIPVAPRKRIAKDVFTQREGLFFSLRSPDEVPARVELGANVISAIQQFLRRQMRVQVINAPTTLPFSQMLTLLLEKQCFGVYASPEFLMMQFPKTFPDSHTDTSKDAKVFQDVLKGTNVNNDNTKQAGDNTVPDMYIITNITANEIEFVQKSRIGQLFSKFIESFKPLHSKEKRTDISASRALPMSSEVINSIITDVVLMSSTNYPPLSEYSIAELFSGLRKGFIGLLRKQYDNYTRLADQDIAYIFPSPLPPNINRYILTLVAIASSCRQFSTNDARGIMDSLITIYRLFYGIENESNPGSGLGINMMLTDALGTISNIMKQNISHYANALATSAGTNINSGVEKTNEENKNASGDSKGFADNIMRLLQENAAIKPLTTPSVQNDLQMLSVLLPAVFLFRRYVEGLVYVHSGPTISGIRVALSGSGASFYTFANTCKQKIISIGEYLEPFPAPHSIKVAASGGHEVINDVKSMSTYTSESGSSLENSNLASNRAKEVIASESSAAAAVSGQDFQSSIFSIPRVPAKWRSRAPLLPVPPALLFLMHNGLLSNAVINALLTGVIINNNGTMHFQNQHADHMGLNAREARMVSQTIICFTLVGTNIRMYNKHTLRILSSLVGEFLPTVLNTSSGDLTTGQYYDADLESMEYCRQVLLCGNRHLTFPRTPMSTSTSVYMTVQDVLYSHRMSLLIARLVIALLMLLKKRATTFESSKDIVENDVVKLPDMINCIDLFYSASQQCVGQEEVMRAASTPLLRGRWVSVERDESIASPNWKSTPGHHSQSPASPTRDMHRTCSPPPQCAVQPTLVGVLDSIGAISGEDGNSPCVPPFTCTPSKTLLCLVNSSEQTKESGIAQGSSSAAGSPTDGSKGINGGDTYPKEQGEVDEIFNAQDVIAGDNSRNSGDSTTDDYSSLPHPLRTGTSVTAAAISRVLDYLGYFDFATPLKSFKANDSESGSGEKSSAQNAHRAPMHYKPILTKSTRRIVEAINFKSFTELAKVETRENVFRAIWEAEGSRSVNRSEEEPLETGNNMDCVPPRVTRLRGGAAAPEHLGGTTVDAVGGTNNEGGQSARPKEEEGSVQNAANATGEFAAGTDANREKVSPSNKTNSESSLKDNSNNNKKTSNSEEINVINSNNNFSGKPLPKSSSGVSETSKRRSMFNTERSERPKSGTALQSLFSSEDDELFNLQQNRGTFQYEFVVLAEMIKAKMLTYHEFRSFGDTRPQEEIYENDNTVSSHPSNIQSQVTGANGTTAAVVVPPIKSPAPPPMVGIFAETRNDAAAVSDLQNFNECTSAPVPVRQQYVEEDVRFEDRKCEVLERERLLSILSLYSFSNCTFQSNAYYLMCRLACLVPFKLRMQNQEQEFIFPSCKDEAEVGGATANIMNSSSFTVLSDRTVVNFTCMQNRVYAALRQATEIATAITLFDGSTQVEEETHISAGSDGARCENAPPLSIVKLLADICPFNDVPNAIGGFIFNTLIASMRLVPPNNNSMPRFQGSKQVLNDESKGKLDKERVVPNELSVPLLFSNNVNEDFFYLLEGWEKLELFKLLDCNIKRAVDRILYFIAVSLWLIAEGSVVASAKQAWQPSQSLILNCRLNAEVSSWGQNTNGALTLRFMAMVALHDLRRIAKVWKKYCVEKKIV